jgi:hypothetical protein
MRVARGMDAREKGRMMKEETGVELYTTGARQRQVRQGRAGAEDNAVTVSDSVGTVAARTMGILFSSSPCPYDPMAS